MQNAKKKPGPKPTYSTPAARYAAYRQRKKERFAALDAETRTIRNELEVVLQEKTKPQEIVTATPRRSINISRLAAAFGTGFREQRRREEDAQRLKSNATKTVNFLNELLHLVPSSAPAGIEKDLEHLRDVLRLVEKTADVFAMEKEYAVATEAQRLTSMQQREQTAKQKTIDLLFGDGGLCADPIEFAASVLEFEVGREAWGRARGYDTCIIDGVTSEGLDSRIRQAIKAEDAGRCAQLVAEIHSVAAARGSEYAKNDRRVWFAGWNDIMNFWREYRDRRPS